MKYTQLVALDGVSVKSANSIFGQDQGDRKIPLVIRPTSRSSFRPITIPEGVYALVQQSGKDIDHSTGAVWPAGLHWIFNPFINVAAFITKQHIVFNTPVKGCKTADDVTVQIDMTLVFRIMGDVSLNEDPGIVRKFVYGMGVGSLQQQLADAQEEAARQLCRSTTHDEVYHLRSSPLSEELAAVENIDLDNRSEEQPSKGTKGEDEDEDEYHSEMIDPRVEKQKRLRAIHQTENIKRMLNEQFNQYGVEIVNVAITDVLLPESFVDQMQEKTTYTSVMEAEKMKQRNDMQLLKYNGELERVKQLKSQENLAEQSRGVEQCAIFDKEVKEAEAQTNKMVAFIQEKQKAMLREKAAETELRVAQLTLEKENILRKLDAESKATAHKLRVSMESEEAELIAKGKLEVAKNKCLAEKNIGNAQGFAAEKLRAKRQHSVMTEQLKVYESLALNPDVVISGNASEKNNNLLASMLVAHREKGILMNNLNVQAWVASFVQ